MGCDGGTIPRRDELVRTKKKPEQKDKDAEREFRWKHCALTQERLRQPIIMCGLGRLYTKQSVLEALLDKQKMSKEMEHVRGLKDIKTLKLTPNPALEDPSDDRHAPYICKLIGHEMSGKFRFVALWTCGCVMSERALKQVTTAGSSGNVCPLCQAPYSVEDVIVLNGNEEDIELMSVKMQMRAAKRKSEKKVSKKDKKERNAVAVEDAEGASTSKAAKEKSAKRMQPVGVSLEDPELKRLKTDFSVAKDPNATEVYKSLFTSHETEKQQERAHWVTYNPFYN